MKRLLLIFLVFILMGCEAEITDFKTKNLSSAIVVYGEMTSTTSPITVRLNYTSGYSPFDVTQFQGQEISGADVRILDELGAFVQLKEIKKGVYQAPVSFKGMVGKKYKLNIRTLDGKIIESTLEEMKAPISLSEFSFSFKNANKIEDSRFELRANLTDRKGTEDYYYIKRRDFIQFLSTCPEPPPPPARVPACNCKCWQAPQNSQPILISDFLLDGSKVNVPLESIDYTDFTDVVVQLEVYSVAKTAFNYWKRQEEQRKIGGGIFDKVPAQIIGNLTCVNEVDQQVLGFFLVGGMRKQRLTVDRFNGITEETFKKLGYYVDFHNVRYKNYSLWNCEEASWIPYNIGLKLPD